MANKSTKVNLPVLRNKEIIQSYILSSAKYDFKADEKKVLTCLVNMFQELLEGKKLQGKVEQDLWKNYHIVMPITYFINTGENYKRIREALFNLNKKSFIYEDDEKEQLIRIIEMPTIFKHGYVEFLLNPKIVECFLNFTKGWRRYELNVSLSFKSVYTMRIYELIAGKNEPITYTFKTLREMFQIQDKYKDDKDFIKRVIKTAQNEMNEKSPITFDYKVTSEITGTEKGNVLKEKSITIYPIKQPTKEEIDIIKQQAIRQVQVTMVIPREIKDYLILTCGFKQNEIKANLDLWNKVHKKLGTQELEYKLREIWARARHANNPKGYMINAIKGEL